MTTNTVPKKLKNPVAANHADYTKATKKWKRCRDACAGSDAIKDAGTDYLPMLSSHKRGGRGSEKYEAYKKRALWYNASRRTRIGLAGAITQTAPKVKTTARFESVAKSVAQHYIKHVEEQLEVGRLALVVNQKDREDAYVVLWDAESVVNWGFTTVNGEQRLRFLVIEDEETESTGEGLQSLLVEPKTVRHVYFMAAGRCMYAKASKPKDKDEWVTPDPVPLTARGDRPLDHIPARIVSAFGVDEPYVDDPLLLDLVDVNISHYMNSADLELGRHWTALPTAWASGFPTKDDRGENIEFAVGGENAWITEQSGAAAGYLEFSGAGLGHISSGMQDKQAMMAVMGARLIEEAKPSVEAAQTIRTRAAGDKSIVSRVCATTSDALTWAFRECLWFNFVGYEEPEDDADSIAVDGDIFNEGMDSGTLTALTAALQQNAISYQTYFARLKEGKVIPESTTIEEESANIDAGRPGAPPDPFQGAPQPAAAGG